MSDRRGAGGKVNTKEEGPREPQDKNKNKSWNECGHRRGEEKMIKGKGSTLDWLIVNAEDSAWLHSNFNFHHC